LLAKTPKRKLHGKPQHLAS